MFFLEQLGSLLNSLCAKLCGLLADGCGHLAVGDSLQAIFRAVKANDLDVASGALAQSFDGAQSHFVVFGEDGLDIWVCLEKVGGHVQAFGPVEVSGLLSNNTDVGVCGNAIG